MLRKTEEEQRNNRLIVLKIGSVVLKLKLPPSCRSRTVRSVPSGHTLPDSSR